MKIAIKQTKSFAKQLERRSRIYSKAIRFGVKESGEALRNSLRKQIRDAGTKRKFANTWQSKHYPNKEYDAATLVYSKAPEIIASLDKGLLIRARKKQWLATPVLGRKQRRTPERLKRDNVVKKFRFVAKDSKTAFLVARDINGKDVIMFVLVKQAKMPKKLDVERAVRQWTGKTPEKIFEELEKQERKAVKVKS